MVEYFVKPVVKEETATLLTTVNPYADLDVFRLKGYKSKCFVLQATGNNLLFSIDFSPDHRTTWVNRLTDIAVNADATVVREDVTNSELRGLWTDCRIQIKPAVGDSHGTGVHKSSFGTL